MYGLDKSLIGLFAGVFSWDTLFQSSLPDYMPRIDCVLQSATVTYTIAIDGGTVSIVGKADLHNNAYTAFGQSFTPDTSAYSTTAVTTFTITMYPSSEFYNKYITQVCPFPYIQTYTYHPPSSIHYFFLVPIGSFSGLHHSRVHLGFHDGYRCPVRLSNSTTRDEAYHSGRGGRRHHQDRDHHVTCTFGENNCC